MHRACYKSRTGGLVELLGVASGIAIVLHINSVRTPWIQSIRKVPTLGFQMRFDLGGIEDLVGQDPLSGVYQFPHP